MGMKASSRSREVITNCGLRSRIAVALCEKFGEMDPVPKATGHLIATHASHG